MEKFETPYVAITDAIASHAKWRPERTALVCGDQWLKWREFNQAIDRVANGNHNTCGGKFVVNPSGGLLSKGHTLGATGLAQCTELVEQLRGHAGPRQVEDARLALQHNLGLGGACVVTLYSRN